MKKSIPFLLFWILSVDSGVSQTDSSLTCRADFAWKENTSIMMFAPGMAVNFYDQTNVEPASWYWEFGDGNSSQEQNPLHIFTFLPITSGGTGYYTPHVCLTIKSSDSCVSKVCKYLSKYGDSTSYPPVCSVYFTPYRNDSVYSIPEVVPYSFKVTAPKSTNSYHWDFGDSTTSDEAFPLHSYPFQGGNYMVCLTIKTDDGCVNSYCSPIYLGYQDSTVTPNCEAYFDYNVMESAPAKYGFQDLSKGEPSAWFWDFADGTYSSEQNPVHVFGPKKDSLDPYLGPPIGESYKVCLTIANNKNCKSTYCDRVNVYGGVDTIMPSPCPYNISLSTSNILGGHYCNGTATASLVDANSNPVEAASWYWSTGQTSPNASGLCVNTPYYVNIVGVDGCQVLGSFAIFDYTKPVIPVGYWTINGNGGWYDFKYNLPDSGYNCMWTFGDGTVVNGTDVNYDLSNQADKNVIVTITDDSGNIVYTEDIVLDGAVQIRQKAKNNLKVYPNPASNILHITNAEFNGKCTVDIYNSLGQCMVKKDYTKESHSDELIIPVENLPTGVYYVVLRDFQGICWSSSFVK